MNRSGSVASSYPVTVGNHPKGVAIADLDGDAKAEIVVCNNAGRNNLEKAVQGVLSPTNACTH